MEGSVRFYRLDRHLGYLNLYDGWSFKIDPCITVFLLSFYNNTALGEKGH